MGGRLRGRLHLCAAHRAPRRPCAGLRGIRGLRRHRRAHDRPADRRILLDPAARMHRLLHGRRLHGHRKLAQRAVDQRESRHGLRPLHDGHLCLDHGRPDDRRRRRCRLGLAVHGHRHLLLPVAASDGRIDRRSSATPPGCLARPEGALRQFAGFGGRVPADRRRQRRMGHARRGLRRADRHLHARDRADDEPGRRRGGGSPDAGRTALRQDRPALRAGRGSTCLRTCRRGDLPRRPRARALSSLR